MSDDPPVRSAPVTILYKRKAGQTYRLLLCHISAPADEKAFLLSECKRKDIPFSEMSDISVYIPSRYSLYIPFPVLSGKQKTPASPQKANSSIRIRSTDLIIKPTGTPSRSINSSDRTRCICSTQPGLFFRRYHGC